MIFFIASQTGWNEDYILWQIPFSRICQYQHSHFANNGIDCKLKRSNADVRDTFNTMRSEFDKARNT